MTPPRQTKRTRDCMLWHSWKYQEPREIKYDVVHTICTKRECNDCGRIEVLHSSGMNIHGFIIKNWKCINAIYDSEGHLIQ